MDDSKLIALANHLTQLTNKYTSGQVKHHIYAADWDKTLEQYGYTKKQLVAELAKLKNKK